MNANTLSLDAMAATNIALKDTRIQEEQNEEEFTRWIVDFLGFLLHGILDLVFSGISASAASAGVAKPT